ncbi:hypothetical protein DFH29DRAFT_1067889 [Suillus ampliporus]|nr:hypothetical protein DFH29DRAFT_1067889 [Suillus ampliporus]
MFPWLASITLQNNLMVLSLCAMMMQSVALMLIAAFCFCGFLYALWTLSRNHVQYSGTIAWWMLDLWFSLHANGFDKAFEFNFVFGPILMITYACLRNTLLLTVVSAMFKKAVSTIEGQVTFEASNQPTGSLHSASFKLCTITKVVLQSQSKKNGSIGLYETITSAAEKVLNTLQRPLKRMYIPFEHEGH